MTTAIPVGRGNYKIAAFQLTERDQLEAIVIYETGEMVLVGEHNGTERELRSLDFTVSELELEIHTFSNYVCVVQKHGLRGVVLDLADEDFKLDLTRGEYLPEHCVFSIGFYENYGLTYLIHATDWNRLDITCMETGELLTDRIIDYETEKNYFDYFHSSLAVSPKYTKFTSNGWVWHPWDIITVYEIKDFLSGFEMSHRTVDIGGYSERGGYNWDRPLCWIDDDSLGIGHNKGEGYEGNATMSRFPSEILIYDTVTNSLKNRIEFDGFQVLENGEAKGELHFDQDRERFISLNPKSGLLVTDKFGKVLSKDEDATTSRYSAQHNLLYRLDTELKNIELKRILL